MFMESLGFIVPPKIRSPLDTKAPGPPLIYLVGPLAILDTHINICVGPLRYFEAIYFPLIHCFEAISFITSLTHQFEVITLD